MRVQLNVFNRANRGALNAFSDGTTRKKFGNASRVNIGWVSAYDNCVRCQCLLALAIGSVTCVQAAPNSINLCGPECIISKNDFTPTAALHFDNGRDEPCTQIGCLWKEGGRVGKITRLRRKSKGMEFTQRMQEEWETQTD